MSNTIRFRATKIRASQIRATKIRATQIRATRANSGSEMGQSTTEAPEEAPTGAATEAPEEAPEGFDRRLILPLIFGSILNPINSSMIAVALVPIGVAFGAPPARTVWLISALYLATAVGQPVVGRLVDMFGPRRLYLTGTATVGIAGVLAFFAPSLWVLVVARVLLGFGTSAAYPAAMFLIRSEARRTGQDSPGGVLTALAIANQVISVVGPTLGGLLVGLGGWQAIFTVNVPLSLACLVLGGLRLPRRVPEDKSGEDTKHRPLDIPGMVLFAAMLIALLLFLMRPRLADWYLPVLALVAATGLTIRERHIVEPFIDVRMLGGNVPLLATYARQVLIFTASYTLMYGYVQWLEDGRRLNATIAGLVVLPTFLVAIGVSALTGRSPALRGKLLVGSTILVGSTPLLLLVRAESPIWLLVTISAVAGVPQGLNGLANQNALYRQADPERMGSAAGLLRTFMYLGAILASAAVAACFPHGATTSGLHDLALLMFACAVLLLAITLPDRSLRQSDATPHSKVSDGPDPQHGKGQPNGSHDTRRAHRARPHRSAARNRRGLRGAVRRR